MMLKQQQPTEERGLCFHGFTEIYFAVSYRMRKD